MFDFRMGARSFFELRNSFEVCFFKSPFLWQEAWLLMRRVHTICENGGVANEPARHYARYCYNFVYSRHWGVIWRR